MSARVICISRAIWVGAEPIAADVAKEFGFRCMDEEIINRAAERRNVAPAEIAGAESRKSFFAQLVEDVRRGGSGELLNYLPTHRVVPVGNEDVRALIREAIRDTAKEGNVVIVAHAASYALGNSPGVLRVLITGSPFVRASRWLTTSGGKSPTEAAETIQESDKSRASYLKRFYDVDTEAPEDYDLTLSTDSLPADAIRDLIIRAARAIP